MARSRGRPVLGAAAGLFFFGFVALELLVFGVVPLHSLLILVLPVLGLLLGIGWAFWAPLRRRGAAPAA